MVSGEVKMVAKHYTPLQYFLAWYEKMLPEQKLAISSGTFFLYI